MKVHDPTPGDDAHLRAIRGLYGDTLLEGDNDAERVGWESHAVQRLRFEALLEALAPSDLAPGTRVLDVGCGLGELVAYLEQSGRHGIDYHGIDALAPMVEGARARFPDARFEHADLFELEVAEPYDLVVCSGGLSIRFGDVPGDAVSWAFIERLYALSRRAVAFNVQSARGLDEIGVRDLRSDFWYVAPEDLVARLQPLCGNLVVREDTVPSDAVVYMYRPGYCRTAQAMAARGALSALERAEIHIQRDEQRAALDFLDADASLAGHPRALFLRGVAQAHDGDVPGAISLLEQALALAPDELDVVRTLVWLHLSEDDLDAACALADALQGPQHQALRRDEVRMVLHERLTALGAADGIYAMEEAAETPFGRLMMEGGRLIACGDWRQAETLLREALAARPADGRPRVLLAVALQRTARPGEALAECLVVLAASPGHEVARDIALEAMRKLTRSAARGRGEAAAQARATLESLRGHAVLGPIVEKLLGGLS